MLLLGIVAQLHLAVLDGTDGADDVGKNGVGGIGHDAVVLCSVGHIIDVMGQKDEIVGIPHIQRLHRLLEEFQAQSLVLQVSIPKVREQTVLLPFRHLPGGKADVQQVSAQSAGQGFFQQAEILLRLLLMQDAQRLVQIGNNLFSGVDITTIHMADKRLFRMKAAAQLADFSSVHVAPRILGNH